MGKPSSAMVYGIVQYDFQAERPDELDARAGEAIIVIAQSNPEWFVAKPIGRLGGPGLIPVSFLELRDMASGKAVTDPLEAVRRAGVPKVEEWKKMTAEYKNSSITLGKFDSGVQSVTAGVDKMSMGQGPSNGNTVRVSAQNFLVAVANLQMNTGVSPAQCQQRNPHSTPTTSPPHPRRRLHPPLLLRQRQVLVHHRGQDGGRSLLGAVPLLP